MIIPIDIKPEYSLYFNGAMILQVMKEMEDEEYELLDLYNKVKKNNNITMQQYLFALDWLYLTGVIKSNINGNILKCF